MLLKFALILGIEFIENITFEEICPKNLVSLKLNPDAGTSESLSTVAPNVVLTSSSSHQKRTKRKAPATFNPDLTPNHEMIEEDSEDDNHLNDDAQGTHQHDVCNRNDELDGNIMCRGGISQKSNGRSHQKMISSSGKGVFEDREEAFPEGSSSSKLPLSFREKSPSSSGAFKQQPTVGSERRLMLQENHKKQNQHDPQSSDTCSGESSSSNINSSSSGEDSSYSDDNNDVPVNHETEAGDDVEIKDDLGDHNVFRNDSTKIKSITRDRQKVTTMTGGNNTSFSLEANFGSDEKMMAHAEENRKAINVSDDENLVGTEDNGDDDEDIERIKERVTCRKVSEETLKPSSVCGCCCHYHSEGESLWSDANANNDYLGAYAHYSITSENPATASPYVDYQKILSKLHAFQFNIVLGADGRRNTLSDNFTRKEFRGKLAIAITANFVNTHTLREAQIEEISGLSFIYNQQMFK